ncbi:hypothetical protein FHX34_102154 [Actinoplanes teichomyceticus]|uniref:Uncharacterized protein n=1 Tax=Actinoplanes teichomyceticus TaxID=1867 RepID=A0A561WIC6_ACTTI|nr:hypothetical protein FHX34_102154 [Actinoplanes teichomyceticus]
MFTPQLRNLCRRPQGDRWAQTNDSVAGIGL